MLSGLPFEMLARICCYTREHIEMLDEALARVGSYPSITDDGDVVLIETAQFAIGAAPPNTYRRMQIANQDPTLEECLWIQCTAANHVGSNANQAINVVLRQAGTSDATATNVTATCIDANVTQTKSAGANSLTNTCILANASGGDVNYSFRSTNGEMVQTGDAHFGNVDCTGTLTATGAFASGAATIGGNLIATGTATLGTNPSSVAHTINGRIFLRSNAADTYLRIQNTSTGGRDYYFEASGDSGQDPNCLAVYDGTAEATRFKIDSSGNCVANVALGAGNARWRSGTGSPEGVVTGNKGDLFSRTDGAAATCLYVKETTGGNTGWVAK